MGTDAHGADPIGGFKLPTEFFAEMGRRVKDLNLPTLVVQEGGYQLNRVGADVRAVLDGLRRVAAGA